VNPQLPMTTVVTPSAELRVVVRVDVDDAGRQGQAVRVHALARGADIIFADGGDAAVRDGERAGASGATAAVDDHRVLDDEIVHIVLLGIARRRRRSNHRPGHAAASMRDGRRGLCAPMAC
jgi:hypothetical protein